MAPNEPDCYSSHSCATPWLALGACFEGIEYEKSDGISLQSDWGFHLACPLLSPPHLLSGKPDVALCSATWQGADVSGQ